MSKRDAGATRAIEILARLASHKSENPDKQALSEIQKARNAFKSSRAALSPDPVEVEEIIDLKAGLIPLRLYRPLGTTADDVLPALIFFHSGGWAVGDIETHDVVCRQLANLARCAVVAVDYRLAPEHKFPAAIDDGLAALDFVLESANALKVDANRIAIGGDSAGANIATVVAILARNTQRQAPILQLLIYPATDFSHEHPSLIRLAGSLPLTRDTLRWTQQQYLRDDADRVDWRVSPLLAEDLHGVAPVFLVTAGFDPLEDEGRAYGERLIAAGVSTEHRHFPGQIHGFINMGGVMPQTALLLAEMACALDRAFFSV